MHAYCVRVATTGRHRSESHDGDESLISNIAWGTGRVLGTVAGEFVVTGAAVLLAVGTAAAFLWGWKNAPTLTIAVGATIALFLTFGVTQIRAHLRGERPRAGRLGTIAVGFALLVAFWLSLVLPVLPWSLS